MPEAVQTYIDTNDIARVTAIHEKIIRTYKWDFSQYEKDKKLKLTEIYDAIPSELEEKNKTQPHLREAHKALAKEVITFIHSSEDYEQALKISSALFSGDIKSLTAKEIEMGFNDLPCVEVVEETPLVDLLISAEVASSKREAREFLRNGAVTINGEKITNEAHVVSKEDAIEGKFIVLRRGKKKYALAKFN